jgi:hypothetical protein
MRKLLAASLCAVAILAGCADTEDTPDVGVAGEVETDALTNGQRADAERLSGQARRGLLRGAEKSDRPPAMQPQ